MPAITDATKLLTLSAILIGIAAAGIAAEPQSRWVHLDSRGMLVYEALPSGDRIMDFSSAGYMGGGVTIPSLPVSKIARPSGGDDTAAIQEAIDSVSRACPVGGFRGAVLLEPGMFKCKATLAFRASGVVLRGSGPKMPEGIYDSHGTRVAPVSLYLEQLSERLGPEARRNVGH
ncbi:MAG TPA: hypothetical protein VGY55_00990 [Pirellulales bacterium]|nr:hypothetical protein [Pirellulales bacterium]